MSDHGQLIGVFAGPVTLLGARGVPSAFVKQRLSEGGKVFELGLEGDSQADLAVHGGVDKAVYAYPFENYAAWLAEYPEHRSLWGPGALGENLSLAGLTEYDVRIGDLFRVGRTVLQVTQPRKPCFKLGLRFDDQRLAAAMVREGRTGWYFRVLESGVVAEGDQVALLERPHPHWTIARVNEAAYGSDTSDEVLRSIAKMPALSAAWRSQTQSALSANAAARLQTGFRPYVLTERRPESAAVCSLTFAPTDGLPAAPHEPGQHLQVRLPPVDGGELETRRYTISSLSNGGTLRISVKQGGAFSRRLLALQVGGTVELFRPQGRFVLDRTAARSLALISAGVGITPMIAMLDAAVIQDGRHSAVPEIMFLHQAPDRGEHPFAQHVEAVAAKYSHVATRIFYSRPDPSAGSSGHVVEGRRMAAADLDDLPLDAAYYVCGPSDFMAWVREALVTRGVPARSIRAETFASADAAVVGASAAPVEAGSLDRALISFERSGTDVEWTPERGTLLDLAQALGIKAPFDCRIGLCGACLTRILEGEVRHVGGSGVEPDDTEALICSALPGSARLVLDL